MKPKYTFYKMLIIFNHAIPPIKVKKKKKTEIVRMVIRNEKKIWR